MERTAYFEIGNSWEHSLSVQAWGYPGDKSGADLPEYNHLSITVSHTKPFLLIFPDGFPVQSNEITESIVRAHVSPLREHYYKIRFLVYEPDADNRKSWYFNFDSDGRVAGIDIQACDVPFVGILGTPDGEHRFNVPIKQDELILLVGKPEKIDSSIAGSIAWERELCPRK